jgi:hypothetical protein
MKQGFVSTKNRKRVFPDRSIGVASRQKSKRSRYSSAIYHPKRRFTVNERSPSRIKGKKVILYQMKQYSHLVHTYVIELIQTFEICNVLSTATAAFVKVMRSKI